MLLKEPVTSDISIATGTCEGAEGRYKMHVLECEKVQAVRQMDHMGL